MSATFRLGLAKKKHSQLELRKLMNQQKAQAAEPTKQKIDSPLAKYNEQGQLTCILCKSIVRSEEVWKVHINAKQHKQNIELAKQLKEKTNNFTKAVKRPASPPPTTVPEKVPRGILKNAAAKPVAAATASTAATESKESNQVPADFFDNPKSTAQSSSYFQATLHKTNIRHDLVHIRRGGDDTDAAMDVDETKDDALPEGFFDDPIKDAKARNTEYKDPVEEEWEKFQHEIKEEANFSNAIMAEDQEEATAERQIDEIDEQIRNWSR